MNLDIQQSLSLSGRDRTGQFLFQLTAGGQLLASVLHLEMEKTTIAHVQAGMHESSLFLGAIQAPTQ